MYDYVRAPLRRIHQHTNDRHATAAAVRPHLRTQRLEQHHHQKPPQQWRERGLRRQKLRREWTWRSGGAGRLLQSSRQHDEQETRRLRTKPAKGGDTGQEKLRTSGRYFALGLKIASDLNGTTSQMRDWTPN